MFRGVSLTAFYFGDNYIRNSERRRAVAQVTYQQRYVNAGWDYVDARDQPSIAARDVRSTGWAVWATPKKPFANGSSLEALLRYDHLNDGQTFNNFQTPHLSQKKIAIHGQIIY
jgi:hypothetical protein